MERYPAIADHGLIGDLQTAALVTTGGVVDWFCCPRFDSPSIFASLLDPDRGGHCSISPAGEECVSRQLYLPDTAILVTRFMSPTGVGEVLDFMPIEDPEVQTAHHRLIRSPRGVRAEINLDVVGRPEQVGGERNWDYRYTWVRDASFSVSALLGLGFDDEAARFIHWLNDRIEQEAAGESARPLKIMYRIDGSSDLDEVSLDHFAGYRGSSPVRVGNGAADQVQLDIYGEAMGAIHLATHHGYGTTSRGWRDRLGL